MPFGEKIGRNVEAYLDDMVIKSKEDDQLLDDVKETMERLRSSNIKLNSTNLHVRSAGR